MKVAWFTPFSNDSAIGRYSASAARALAEFTPTDLFVFQTDNLIETDLQVVHFTADQALPLLRDYDVCVYNLGDYYAFHAPIYEVMVKKRGVAILHDLSLHNFFYGYFYAHRRRPAAYARHLRALYGPEEAERILKAARTPQTWEDLDFLKYNLNELVVPYCSGLIVHSQYHLDRIKNVYQGPVCQAPLIYEPFGRPTVTPAIKNFYDPAKFNLLTVGHANPNKRILVTLEALGTHAHLRKRVTLTCIGALTNESYVRRLKALIKKHRLENNVRLLGYVDSDRLAGFYKYADAAVNLRNPAYEGGSASLVEQMMLGKCSIISDTGCYAEIPDDCAIKISTSDEVRSFAEKLSALLKQPKKAEEIGARAKSYAQRTFAAPKYGRLVNGFIRSAAFLNPLYQLTDLLAAEWAHFGLSGEEACLSGKVAREMELLFGGRRTSAD